MILMFQLPLLESTEEVETFTLWPHANTSLPIIEKKLFSLGFAKSLSP